MNIKIASEKTGLTKKAIKYYEMQGLISPLKDEDNNYRVYGDEDIIRLNLIGALRVIDIPVSEIKSLLQGNKNFKQVMQYTLDKITEDINAKEKSKIIISSILSKNSEDYKNSYDEIKKLRETLEFSQIEKREYISTTLLRVFPGNFGRIFVSLYEPFLNIILDSDEKKQAWIKLVEFLDNLNEADIENPIIKDINNINEDKIESFKKDIRENIKKILSSNKNELEEFKQKFIKSNIDLRKNLLENEELKIKFKKSFENSKNMINDMGYPDNKLDEYLEILSEDYRRYRTILNELNNEADIALKKEFGVTIKEIFQDL